MERMKTNERGRTHRGAGAWNKMLSAWVTPTPLVPVLRPSTTSGVLQQLYNAVRIWRGQHSLTHSVRHEARETDALVDEVHDAPAVQHPCAVEHVCVIASACVSVS